MLDKIRIVLLETSHPGNIGATARAMKNMGLQDLALVNPDHFPHPQALHRASGATDILDRAGVYASLDEALEGCVRVAGTSARSRTLPWPHQSPRVFAREWASDAEAQKTAIVFGREERGLTNAELQRCHVHLGIPANPDYAALNLAMAVQVIAYEMRMAHLEQSAEGESRLMQPGDKGWDEPPATALDVEGVIGHLEETLVMVGFHDPENPRQLIPRLRRLYQRAHLDKMEVNILRGAFKAIQKAVRAPRPPS